CIYQETKPTEQPTALLQEAARDVEALQPFIELAQPCWIIWLYYEITGDKEKALNVARRSLEKSGGPMAAFCCAIDLYQTGRFIEALQCLDQRRQTELGGDVTRAFVLAELLPDGPQRALQEYDKITRKYPRGCLEEEFSSDVLLLLGRKEQARET